MSPFGLVALSRVDVIASAHIELAELRDSVDASLLLAVWGTNGPTIVRWLEPARPVTFNVRVGSNMPLLRSATGQVFAAQLPQSITHSLIKADLNEIKKLQGKAPTLHEAKEALKIVRKRGLGHTAGGVLPGVLALAAPIYNTTINWLRLSLRLGPRATSMIRARVP